MRFCFITDTTLFFPGRVERKERARLKTVKFNAKPGSFDSKAVSDFPAAAKVAVSVTGFIPVIRSVAQM